LVRSGVGSGRDFYRQRPVLVELFSWSSLNLPLLTFDDLALQGQWDIFIL
jgi:hypothetical protein